MNGFNRDCIERRALASQHPGIPGIDDGDSRFAARAQCIDRRTRKPPYEQHALPAPAGGVHCLSALNHEAQRFSFSYQTRNAPRRHLSHAVASDAASLW